MEQVNLCVYNFRKYERYKMLIYCLIFEIKYYEFLILFVLQKVLFYFICVLVSDEGDVFFLVGIIFV